MDPTPAAERRPRHRLKITACVVGVLVVALGATAPFGGLDKRQDPPKRVRPGQTIDQKLFKIQVVSAQAGPLGGGFGAKKNLLAVWMRVTNQGEESFSVGRFLDGVAFEPKPGQYVKPYPMLSVAQVGTRMTDAIHPRMPVDVRVTWELAPGTVPQGATIAVREWKHDQSFTTETFEWMSGKTARVLAKVALPVHPGGGS